MAPSSGLGSGGACAQYVGLFYLGREQSGRCQDSARRIYQKDEQYRSERQVRFPGCGI